MIRMIKTTQIARLTADDLVNFQMSPNAEIFIDDLMASIKQAQQGIKSPIIPDRTNVTEALYSMVDAIAASDMMAYNEARDIEVSSSTVEADVIKYRGSPQ